MKAVALFVALVLGIGVVVFHPTRPLYMPGFTESEP